MTRRGARPKPNKPFNGELCIRYDNGYYLNCATFVVLGGEDLWIRFCYGRAPKKTALDFYVDCFRSYAAIEVIQGINGFFAGSGTAAVGKWGKHFEDGILEIWRALGLPFGYIKSILRSV
jgi:hypothetical protein